MVCCHFGWMEKILVQPCQRSIWKSYGAQQPPCLWINDANLSSMKEIWSKCCHFFIIMYHHVEVSHIQITEVFASLQIFGGDWIQRVIFIITLYRLILCMPLYWASTKYVETKLKLKSLIRLLYKYASNRMIPILGIKMIQILWQYQKYTRWLIRIILELHWSYNITMSCLKKISRDLVIKFTLP